MNRKFWFVAAVLVLIAAFATSAASAVTKTDKKQNKQIKALEESNAELAPAVDGLQSDVGGVKTDLGGVQTNVGGLQVDLQALAVKVTDGLAQAAALSSGLAQATASLAQLNTRFQTFVDSPEYGFVQLYFDPEGDGFEANDAVPGQLLVTADIPDDTNQATVSGTLALRVPDGTSAKRAVLKAAIRSGEEDGNGAADPVGHAGLMAMSAAMIGAAGTTSIGGGNPGSTALPLTSAPNPSAGGMPIYPIANKAARAGANPSVFPDTQSIELTDPATLQILTSTPTRYTVTNVSGGDATAIFTVTVRFNDLTPADPDNLGE